MKNDEFLFIASGPVCEVIEKEEIAEILEKYGEEGLIKILDENPNELLVMIDKYILNVNKPKAVPPKPRAARGSRKMRGNFFFTKQDMERLLNMARIAGDKELVKKLTPREDLRTIKRKLISSIRHGRIERDLWESYVEAQTNQNQTTAAQLTKSDVQNAFAAVAGNK